MKICPVAGLKAILLCSALWPAFAHAVQSSLDRRISDLESNLRSSSLNTFVKRSDAEMSRAERAGGEAYHEAFWRETALIYLARAILLHSGQSGYQIFQPAWRPGLAPQHQDSDPPKSLEIRELLDAAAIAGAALSEERLVLTGRRLNGNPQALPEARKVPNEYFLNAIKRYKARRPSVENVRHFGAMFSESGKARSSIELKKLYDANLSKSSSIIILAKIANPEKTTPEDVAWARREVQLQRSRWPKSIVWASRNIPFYRQ